MKKIKLLTEFSTQASIKASELFFFYRNEKEITNIMLTDAIWKKYQPYLKRLRTLAEDMPDFNVPFEFVYTICEQSKSTYQLFYERVPAILCNRNEEQAGLSEEVIPSEILARFGYKVLNAINEKGKCEVSPKILRNSVEVIGYRMLTSVAIQAILRTDLKNKSTLAGKELVSANRRCRYFVEERSSHIHKSARNFLKMKSQEEQGILPYILIPHKSSCKPEPGELLTIQPSS